MASLVLELAQRLDFVEKSLKPVFVDFDEARDDISRLVNVSRTQVCYLCSLELRQVRFSPKCFSDGARRFVRVELGERFDIVQCFVIHRRVWRVLFPVFEEVLYLGDE